MQARQCFGDTGRLAGSGPLEPFLLVLRPQQQCESSPSVVWPGRDICHVVCRHELRVPRLWTS